MPFDAVAPLHALLVKLQSEDEKVAITMFVRMFFSQIRWHRIEKSFKRIYKGTKF